MEHQHDFQQNNFLRNWAPHGLSNSTNAQNTKTVFWTKKNVLRAMKSKQISISSSKMYTMYISYSIWLNASSSYRGSVYKSNKL